MRKTDAKRLKFRRYFKFLSEKKKKDEKLPVVVEKKKIQLEVAKLHRYLSRLTKDEFDHFIAVVAIANATEDENLIEYITKIEQVTREEEGKFMTTNELKEVALTAEARGASAVRKINNVSAKRLKPKNEGKKGKDEMSKLKSDLVCFNCGREGHLQAKCNCKQFHKGKPGPMKSYNNKTVKKINALKGEKGKKEETESKESSECQHFHQVLTIGRWVGEGLLACGCGGLSPEGTK